MPRFHDKIRLGYYITFFVIDRFNGILIVLLMALMLKYLLNITKAAAVKGNICKINRSQCIKKWNEMRWILKFIRRAICKKLWFKEVGWRVKRTFLKDTLLMVFGFGLICLNSCFFTDFYTPVQMLRSGKLSGGNGTPRRSCFIIHLMS